MSNYIDSDRIDLKNYLMHKDGEALYSDDFFEGIKWVIDRIDEMPSIDIVRCKDCISNDINCGGEDNWCLYFGHDVYNDDFCSYGERKDNE